jgi:hypothetical protein
MEEAMRKIVICTVLFILTATVSAEVSVIDPMIYEVRGNVFGEESYDIGDIARLDEYAMRVGDAFESHMTAISGNKMLHTSVISPLCDFDAPYEDRIGGFASSFIHLTTDEPTFHFKADGIVSPTGSAGFSIYQYDGSEYLNLASESYGGSSETVVFDFDQCVTVADISQLIMIEVSAGCISSSEYTDAFSSMNFDISECVSTVPVPGSLALAIFGLLSLRAKKQ